MTDKMVGRQLLELGPDDCRYPFGDAAPYTFCGDIAVVGSSYCELHRLICTKPDHGLGGRTNQNFSSVMRKNNLPKCMVVSESEGLL